MSGTFWQATQPVSGTVTTSPPANASTNVAQFGGTNISTGTGVGGAGIPRVTVSSDSFPASQAVTGTFWQGTQPVSIAAAVTVAQSTAANLLATVTQGPPGTAANGWYGKVTDGTNTAAVKAASTAAIATDPALVVAISPNNSVAVTGAFWQATQPVSGTFWQATQPVSGSVSVTGTATVAGTVTANQGGAPWSENVTQFGGTNISTGTGVGGAGIPRVTVSSDSFPATQAVSGTVNTKNALTGNSPAVGSVGVASASLLAANASRKGCVITNTSVNNISLGFGAAAVLGSGITLPPWGVFQMDEYMFSVAQIFAIASAAASSVAVQEWQ